MILMNNYRKTSNISRTLVGNQIVGNSDVVGASPVGAAPTTSWFPIQHLISMDWAKTTAHGYKKHLNFGIWCDLYYRFYGNHARVENHKVSGNTSKLSLNSC